MEKIEGYKGHQIWIMDREEAERMLDGSAKEIYDLYKICYQTWYYQNQKNDEDKENGMVALGYSKKIEKKLKEILKRKEYPVEKKHLHNEQKEERIYFTLGDGYVRYLPFLNERDMDIGKYIFDEKGGIRTWAEVKDMIRENVGEEEFDLSKLDDEIRVLVDAVRREENIEIQDVKQEREVTRIMGWEIIRVTGMSKSGEVEKFIILPGGDEEGEKIARERLEDGNVWRSVVDAGGTADGLEKWIDIVMVMYGWGNELSHYDGAERYTKTAKGEKVVYYRSN